MKFKIVETVKDVSEPKSIFLLVRDYWDDWKKYRTQFHAYFYDEDGEETRIGEIKIGKAGLLPGSKASKGVRAPDIPDEFERLGDDYFSLGQGASFYEALNSIGEDIRSEFLEAIRDVAYDLSVFERYYDEDVMQESLLRGVRAENVRTKLHRLAHGVSQLTEFKFKYFFPVSKTQLWRQEGMEFHVVPESIPPTNIHVLIGRNGVGKTRLLRNMGKALLGLDGEAGEAGEVRSLNTFDGEWYFSGIVSVSFSAFDDYEFPIAPSHGIKASMIGLRDWSKSRKVPSVKSPEKLAGDFIGGLQACRFGLRAARWRRAVRVLENDPLFKEADVVSLLDDRKEDWDQRARHLFSGLSSGHKIVLLTITKLVELVDERTLVLMDEPEGHLHPPLLSAFLQSITDLLVKRNGVAVIATHSPVVLQEVPRSCVWVLDRVGAAVKAERPDRETYGENVGLLTRDVFSLEVTTTGFHRMLADLIARDLNSYEDVIDILNGQLGAEGRAIARAIEASLRGRGD